MVYKVFSGAVKGVFGELITVEMDSSTGLPCFDMVGLLSSEVKEAKERVRVALRNNSVTLPAMRMTVSLSPADEHKEGAAFDLPIAISILGLYGYIPGFNPNETLVIGELSLDGQIKPVRGILPIVKMALDKGFKSVILPESNKEEGALIRGIEILPVKNLGQILNQYSTEEAGEEPGIITPFLSSFDKTFEAEKDEPDFSSVYGQKTAKRAAAISAAGFHHLLLIGPPGTGKSLIAKRIPGIMPRLSYEECIEVSSIYSVSGKLSRERPIITNRPFLSPHCSATTTSIFGGGPKALPGLVSLSHKGIMFLDEMPEFRRESLEMLRQPLEDGKITVSRNVHSYTYPSQFMLVGAMNPCPCGFYPDTEKCTCTPAQRNRYMARISGPILDRIDICAEVNRISIKSLNNERTAEESSECIRERVEKTVERQKRRYRNEAFQFNSQIPVGRIDEFVPLGEGEKEFLHSMYESLNLSMRSYFKTIRVARTIADYDGDEDVEIKHLCEASLMRIPEYLGG